MNLENRVEVARVAPHQTTAPLQEATEAGATPREEVQETELPQSQNQNTDWLLMAT